MDFGDHQISTVTFTVVNLLHRKAARAGIIGLGINLALQWDLKTSLQQAKYSRLLHGPEALPLISL